MRGCCPTLVLLHVVVPGMGPSSASPRTGTSTRGPVAGLHPWVDTRVSQSGELPATGVTPDDPRRASDAPLRPLEIVAGAAPSTAGRSPDGIELLGTRRPRGPRQWGRRWHLARAGPNGLLEAAGSRTPLLPLTHRGKGGEEERGGGSRGRGERGERREGEGKEEKEGGGGGGGGGKEGEEHKTHRVAVPGRHRPAGAAGVRPSAARPVPRPAERRRARGHGHRHRPRRARGAVRGDGAARLRLPRAGARRPGQLLRCRGREPSTRSRCTRSPTPCASRSTS